MSACNHNIYDSSMHGKHIGSGDGMVWAPLHYKIKLPDNDSIYLRDYKYDIYVVCPDSQYIIISSQNAWLNYDPNNLQFHGVFRTPRDPSETPEDWNTVMNYKGYFIQTFYSKGPYLGTRTYDVRNFDNDLQYDINHVAYSQGKRIRLHEPISGRKSRVFVKNGVKVILYNILPQNMEKYYKILYNSVRVVPFKKSCLKDWEKGNGNRQ